MTPEALRRRMAHGNIYTPEKVDAALGQLLPGRQPRRAARAGPAVGRRPGRRGAAALPRAPRHRRAVGDPGAGRRRAHRRARRRAPDPPGRPHGRRGPRATSSGSTSQADDGLARPARPSALDRAPASCSSELGGTLPRGRRRRRRRRRSSTSPGPRTPPSSSSAPATGRGSRELAPRVGHQRRASGSRATDRRPRHLDRRRAEDDRASAAPAAPAPARRRLPRAGAGRRLGRWPLVGLPLLTRAAGAVPRPPQPPDGAAPATSSLVVVVAAVGGVGPAPAPPSALGSCSPTGTSRRRCTPGHDRRPRERPRPRRLPRGRGRRRVVARRRRGPPARPTRPRARAEAETLARLAGAVAGEDDPLAGAGRASSRPPSACDAVAVLRADERRWTRRGRRGERAPARPAARPTRRGRCRWADGRSCSPVGDLAADDRARPERLHRPARGGRSSRRRLQAEAAAGRPPRRGRRAADRAARRGVARPAHPAGVDQGVRSRACCRRRRLAAATRSREFLDHDRRGDRPAHDAGRQPARHEPAPGRRADARTAAGRRSTRSCPPPLASLGDRARATSSRSTCPRRCPGSRPTRRCSSGRSPTWSTTRSPGRRRSERVRVEAGAVGGHVDVRVVDRGPGIPPAERDRVFQPFQRLGDRSERRPASGSASPSPAGFIEAMGGELDGRGHARRRHHDGRRAPTSPEPRRADAPPA